MVSVIVPTFNRGRTILRAINSILNQTYKDIEVIVVDDCSTDDTKIKIESLNNNMITYIKHDRNKGACAARNTGIKVARGEYIAFLDSDDEWMPAKVEKQLKFLEVNNADIVFCSHISYFNGKKAIVPEKKINSDLLYKKLLQGNFITTGSILGKTECFNQINFDLKLPRFQDWDLMINMTRKFNVQHLPEILTVNYVQEDSITRDERKGLEALKIIYSKLLDLNCIDNSLKANFYNQMGSCAVKADELAVDYFKESFKNKVTFKVFIKYIICLLGFQKLLQEIINKRNS